MLDHFFLKLLMTIHPVWPQVPFGEKRVGAFAVVGAGGWVVLANLETFLVGGLSGLQREVTCMERHAWETWGHAKLQALVYVILPSTTAVFSYVIGSRKLSANEQFFVGAQTVVSFLQTTQIISDVCFITDHAAYASSNKTPIV